MPYSGEQAARINDPSKYKSFARQNDKGGSGVDFIFGIKADGSTELQAIRFDSSKFTPTEAKSWLKEHNQKPILFEEAIQDACKKPLRKQLIDDWRRCVAKHAIGIDVTTQARRTLRQIEKHRYLKQMPMQMLGASQSLYKSITERTVELNVEVLKFHKGTKNRYDVGYAIDSAKPRVGTNIVCLGTTGETDIVARRGDVVSVIVKSIVPKVTGNYWGVSTSSCTVNKLLTRKTSDTTKEILHKAEESKILDYEHDSIFDSLFEKKLVKGLTAQTQVVKDNGLSFQTKLIKAETKQIVYGVVYAPSVVDAHGDITTAEEIENAAHAYLEDYSDINLLHQKPLGESVRVCESWIAPMNMTINQEPITKGSWVMAVHIKDAALWSAVESGELSAFSIEGTGERSE